MLTAKGVVLVIVVGAVGGLKFDGFQCLDKFVLQAMSSKVNLLLVRVREAAVARLEVVAIARLAMALAVTCCMPGAYSSCAWTMLAEWYPEPLDACCDSQSS